MSLQTARPLQSDRRYRLPLNPFRSSLCQLLAHLLFPLFLLFHSRLLSHLRFLPRLRPHHLHFLISPPPIPHTQSSPALWLFRFPHVLPSLHFLRVRAPGLNLLRSLRRASPIPLLPFLAVLHRQQARLRPVFRCIPMLQLCLRLHLVLLRPHQACRPHYKR